jgi:hypothetical protein
MEAWAKPQGNLDLQSRSSRLRGGVVVASLSLVATVVMVKLGASAWAKLGLVFPLFLASFLFHQGLFNT